MAFAPRRRRRRSRWLLVGVVLSVLAVFVNAGFSARSKGPSRRLAALAYIDQVRPQVERSTALGSDVAEVRTTAGQLGRNGIRRSMERVGREAAAELRAVRRLEPPAGLSTGHTLLVATMVLRARASSAIGAALSEELGTAPIEPTVDELVAAAEDLVAADRTYRAFVELVSVKGARSPLLPSSTWVADPEVWSRPEVTAFVASLRSSAISGPVNDVGLVTLSTDPAPVGNETGSAVLPLVKVLKVEVVVANLGNKAATAVPVVATITGPGGEVDTAKDLVDLAPGQRRTVPLGGLHPVPGGPSTLMVMIGPVEGESATVDNQRSISLVLRG